MHEGYFKFSRRLLDSDFWKSEPFTKPQAWIDLCGLANHKPGSVWIRGIEVKVGRGQTARSELTLAKRWKWSRDKVRRFLNRLETRQQIEQQKSNLTSLITIKNYNRYQGNDTPNDTPEKHQKNTKRYTNNNEKNNKNIKDSANADEIKKTDMMAEKLYRAKKFDKVNAFVNKMRKLKKNESAILHILTDFSKRKIPEGSAWAYCFKALERESGNFYEQEHRQRVEKQKRELEQWEKKLSQVQ